MPGACARQNASACGPLAASISADTARGYIRHDRMLFGQVLEHFHRQIHGGIFEPGPKLSDSKGFRLDVIEARRSSTGIRKQRHHVPYASMAFRWTEHSRPRCFREIRQTLTTMSINPTGWRLSPASSDSKRA
jgi:hypothetical protein